jgi:hypothetical protein
MSGEESGYRIRMQNAWGWNPSWEDSGYPAPRHASPLTAAAQDEPPQSSQALPEDTQPVDVSQDLSFAKSLCATLEGFLPTWRKLLGWGLQADLPPGEKYSQRTLCLGRVTRKAFGLQKISS